MNFEIAPKETEIQANWDDAKLYCLSLNVDGKTEWRLPTKDELNQISIQIDLLGYFYTGGYWSSSESYSTYACSQWFTEGDPYCLSDKRSPYYVRAIRAF